MAKQSVLITGCSDDGIGYGIALACQERGLHVFATARNTAKMTKLKDLANVTFLTLDVTNKDHINAAVEEVQKQTGGTLNYLVNNAGHNHWMPILDEDLQETRDLFETNLWGPLSVTQAFAPLVIKAKGTITFITSISGYINVPWMGEYTTKPFLFFAIDIFFPSDKSLEKLADTS
jgi:1-acylglycerone phosphate reductase